MQEKNPTVTSVTTEGSVLHMLDGFIKTAPWKSTPKKPETLLNIAKSFNP